MVTGAHTEDGGLLKPSLRSLPHLLESRKVHDTPKSATSACCEETCWANSAFPKFDDKTFVF